MAALVLVKIVAAKKREVAEKQRSLPLANLKARLSSNNAPRDFATAIKGNNIKLVAEVKKASPSRGVLVREFDPVALASTFESGGAAAISVLTETAYFQGNLKYLEQIREKVGLPLLRKDFIFDEYQVYESAACGADALLLIASILSPDQLRGLLEVSHDLGLSCLVEVHDEKELDEALNSGAAIIGINNRDLNTFKTDIETTRRLRPLVPDGKIVVSESGIVRREDVKKLREWRVDAVLVGEALVTAPDIPARIKELMS
jgi:indole-3-glycerol phosphate synthase